jgi:hypothetical protein
MRMDRPRRFNPLWLLALFFVVIGTVMVFAAGEGPSAVASRFMQALASGDAKTLTELSHMGDEPAQETQKRWEKTLDYSQHYLFAWRIVDDREQSDEAAVVKLKVVRNAKEERAYEEDYELPLTKVGGKWKVDVRQIPREMYPALPR